MPPKRCRSFDLEIRGCAHLQELSASCVQKLEAALESAISRIPEEVTKALTSFLSHAPRTLVDQNWPPRYKLRFMNGLSNEVFTKKGICAANGDPLKISVEENNQQGNSSHRLLCAKIKIVVLDGDFNIENEESWTSEDFSKHIVRPRDKVGAVLAGELELSLKNGEAYLRDATFIDNSKFTRSGKFRLGVMVIDELGERVKEGITEPFTVKDRRGEGSKKHDIPSLDDDVWRLTKISKDGVFHEALKGSAIFSVKDFLRLYYKDEHTLRKILIKAPKLVWTNIVDHAKMSDPGKELYSFPWKAILLCFSSTLSIRLLEQHCMTITPPSVILISLHRTWWDNGENLHMKIFPIVNLIMKWIMANQGQSTSVIPNLPTRCKGILVKRVIVFIFASYY